MENIETKEKELFQEWHTNIIEKVSKQIKKEYNEDKFVDNLYEFIEDGIISEKEWSTAPLKIIFVLKEANNSYKEHKEDWMNFKRFLADSGGGRTTFANISRWAYGILNIDENLSWNDIHKKGLDSNERKKILRQVCVVNLSKQPGDARTKFDNLKEKFERYNKEYLEKQLAFYADADIIICCGNGVGSLFKSALSKNNFGEYKPVGKIDGIWHNTLGNGQLMISYYHPAASAKGMTEEKLFKSLLAVVKTNYKKKS
jgi:hypothetical protein